MSILLWTNVLHLVDVTALAAAAKRAVLGNLQLLSALAQTMGAPLVVSYRDPDHGVGVGRITSAANVLLLTSSLDWDGVLHGSYFEITVRPTPIDPQ